MQRFFSSFLGRATLLGLGFLLLGCSARKHDYAQISTADLPQEVFCTYRKAGDTIHTTRALTTAAGTFRVLRYAVYPAGEAGVRQQLRTDETVSRSALAGLEQQARQRTAAWPLPPGEQELFVQIRPRPQDGGDMAVLRLRQEVEGEIDEALTAAGIGQWSAGDLGPGGGNMLFTISNYQRAQAAIIKVLRAYDIEPHTVVARRIMTAPDDWTYEVLYPVGYVGTFNQM